LSGLFDELRRRNVVRVGIAYILVAWITAQVAELALDSFVAPDWVIKTVLLLLALGLPVALFLAWAFELTPEGLKKEKDVDRSQSITQSTGQKLNALIISVLVIAVSMLLVDKFFLQSENTAPAAEVATTNSRSVAVLPFVDMSPSKDQEYFTDGLTENLLHALAQIRELKVAGRTSSFAFKGLNADLRDIGRQLNVGSILEGSVQKAGGRIRITTQLINAEDGYHLWSETFDRDLTDIFKVQDEIAEAVAIALRISLLGEETAASRSTNDFEAYNAYLLGLSFYNKTTLDDWDAAIEQFEHALDIDPNMALAWAGLSLAQSARTGMSTDFAEGYALAREMAEKAIELDPNLADAHLALADVQLSSDWDWDGAQDSLDRAIALRPGDPDIIAKQARLKGILGEYPGALDLTERAISQDPLNNSLVRSHIAFLAQMDHVDEAVERAQFIVNATPNTGGVHASLANLLIRLGKYEEALSEAEKEGFVFLRLELEARIYHQLGDNETAQQKLQELVDTFGDDVSWQVARVYATWGDKENAFAALERGFAVRDPGLVFIKGGRILDFLRDDPRYDDLLKGMHLR
jgi:adenylate cyclase